MRNRKILVADDDLKLVNLVKAYLQKDGYGVIVAYDGAEALALARHEKPTLIVLDLLMPKVNGMEVCEVLRQESDVPIIMLTAKSTEEDKLAGLESGADDYITKPFSPRELIARIRTVLRRVALEERGPREIAIGDLEVNFVRHEAKVQGKVVNLTPNEFKLLGVLIKEPGRAFTRLQLIDAAMGYSFEGFERTIDAHIMNLRHKVEPNPKQPLYIKTVYGVGYKFEGPQDVS